LAVPVLSPVAGFMIQFINLSPSSPVDWVDVHLTITSATVNGQFNYRMVRSNSDLTTFSLTLPTVDGVTVPADAVITYSFTYCVQMTACDTGRYSFSRSPDTGALVTGHENCPAINFISTVSRDEHTGSVILAFESTTVQKDVMWVDVHVAIDTAMLLPGQGQRTNVYNYRMTRSNSNSFRFTYSFPGIDGVRIHDTDYITYFYTYCAEMVDCNSITFQSGAAHAYIRSLVLLQQGIEPTITEFNSTGILTNGTNTNNNTIASIISSSSSTGGSYGFASLTHSSTGSGNETGNGNGNGNPNKNGSGRNISASPIQLVLLLVATGVMAMAQHF